MLDASVPSPQLSIKDGKQGNNSPALIGSQNLVRFNPKQKQMFERNIYMEDYVVGGFGRPLFPPLYVNPDNWL